MRRINPEGPLTSQQKYKRYYDKHREEVLEKNAVYLKENKEKVNRRVRNRRHGITQEQLDVKMAEQNNCCAVCGKEFQETPHIDHNHACCPKLRSCDKCRRGLLCAPCNVMIGMAQESIEVLTNAIQYLKGYQK
jgi:recombination endonuclease VII